MKYRYILFDLDGTLTDPKTGITKAVAYALDKMGYSYVDLNDLTKFIGPPLYDSFSDYYQMDLEQVKQAIDYYREYFKEKGIFENEIYEGIRDLLIELKINGCVLAVATSKPTVFAEIIIKYFNLDPYFDIIVGSNLDGTRVKKGEVIAYTLEQLNVRDTNNTIMVGDREHDIFGANQNGLDSIGVEYGYGSKEELEEAGATFVVNSVEALATLLIS